MKLVLTHDVPSLGKTHDVVDVKAGFGRNYLLPRGLATFLTPGLLKALDAERAREAVRHEKMAGQAKELQKTLDGLVIQFRRKAAKGGKLYGGISRSMIAKQLKAEHAIELSPSAIKLIEPMRETGSKKVKIHFGEHLDATITVKIAAEK